MAGGRAELTGTTQNCAIKQPEPKALKGRYRRLCEPCVQAPLKDHINPIIDPDCPASSTIIQQGICQCETHGVWLCQPCGRSIRNQDQTYLRLALPTRHPSHLPETPDSDLFVLEYGAGALATSTLALRTSSVVYRVAVKQTASEPSRKKWRWIVRVRERLPLPLLPHQRHRPRHPCLRFQSQKKASGARDIASTSMRTRAGVCQTRQS